jgi:hypothetical protein|uniref:PGDYG protein n=1 Tax=Myoviridae sp. ctdNl2 TaxID=2825140 RepID=A0A8S5QH66_9CAUD|nr:MAG TPA: PGDYG protein [Myoviridae sp. ctdNl2]
MEKYIKKPVVVDAFQYFYNNEKSTEELKNHVGMDNCFFDCDGKLFLRTFEGALKVRDGDYIIKGVKGEFYSCREDIFNLTYNTTKIDTTRFCVHLCEDSFYSFDTFKSIDEAKSFGRKFFTETVDPNDLNDCNCLFNVDDYVDTDLDYFYVSKCKHYMPDVFVDDFIDMMQDTIDEDFSDCYLKGDILNEKEFSEARSVLDYELRKIVVSWFDRFVGTRMPYTAYGEPIKVSKVKG